MGDAMKRDDCPNPSELGVFMSSPLRDELEMNVGTPLCISPGWSWIWI